MTRVWAAEVSRSMADWARRVSAVMVSHSAGSRLEVTMVLGGGGVRRRSRRSRWSRSRRGLRSAKSSRIRTSTGASWRISASRVLSRRAARSRVNSLSARAKWT